nr:transposase [Hungatella effluvii]
MQRKKTKKKRSIRVNSELTPTYREAVKKLESIHGALLRMNLSIQTEGTFGILKNDRWYKRIVLRGSNSVRMETFLVSIGCNLYKYHKKTDAAAENSIILW